ncbi:hypothetical protein IWW38_005032, partial [Coemansia aciculifera]
MAPLDEWQREWWSMVLTTLFNEALGFFQSLYDLVTAQLESAHALPYAIQYLRSGTEPPASFQIARRLLVYVGDIYRYQLMYLPQLAVGSAGPIDTAELLDLARCTYARASAMYFDSGRACMQMSLLLSVCTNQRFSAMFWHMCGLCYADHQHIRQRTTMAMRKSSEEQDDDSDDDPIEQLVVELVQAVVNGNKETDEMYRQLQSSLNDDWEEAQRGMVELVDLDAGFWEREYQLGVALAGLLTATEGQAAGDHSVRIQDLAVVLVQRQAMCLQQALALGGGTGTGSGVYPAISICVWIDLWRSTGWLDARAGSAQEALLVLLSQLINEYSAAASSSGTLEEVAQTVLAHDVALMGWRTLRSVQQRLRYEEIGQWQPPDAQTTVRVVLARAQLLVQALVGRSCAVPDAEFWCQRLKLVREWVRAGDKYRVVMAADTRRQLEADGGSAAKAALAFAARGSVVEHGGLAQWEDDAMAFMTSGDEEDEWPVAADVPEEARAALS